jgi:predicted MFS family arabinose efflux permease
MGGWKAPFFVIAALGAVVASAAVYVMPPMRGHLVNPRGKPTPTRPLGQFLADKSVLLSFAGIAVAMMGTFAIVANLSSYIQFNLGYPREHMGILYTAGGLFSFFAMRVAGKQADKRGPLVVVVAGTVLITAIIGVGFLPARPLIPIIGIFIGFMVANPTRMVALNALTSRVPAPQERGRFMSLQSTVQHLASAVGSGASTWILRERPDRSLAGMPTLAVGAIGLALTLPLLVAALAKRLAPTT